MRRSIGLTLFFTLLFTTAVHGAIVEYNVVKLEYYVQTADNTAPPTLDEIEFFAQLFTDNPADFAGVQLNGGGGGPHVLTQFGADWEFSQTFASLAALNAVFPDGGAYSLETSGGGLGALTEPISFPAGAFPTVPFFTGTVFSDADGLNPSQGFTFSWNTPPGDILFFTIIESASGNEVFSLDGFRNGNENETSVVVPGGTLVANTDYEAILTFGTGVDDNRTIFASGSGLAARGRETDFEFTTGLATGAVPEPSSTVLLSSLLLGVLIHRLRRQ